MIAKMARKGLTPSQIGVLLRDQHGVAQVKSVTGNKILRILKGQGEAAGHREVVAGADRQYGAANDRKGRRTGWMGQLFAPVAVCTSAGHSCRTGAAGFWQASSLLPSACPAAPSLIACPHARMHENMGTPACPAPSNSKWCPVTACPSRWRRHGWGLARVALAHRSCGPHGFGWRVSHGAAC